MRRLRAYLPVVALGLLAAWPMLYDGPSLHSADGPNHFYRFAALAWHIRHGDWYPRWFSDVHYGFGGPILNFYSPLAYYILAGLLLFSPTYPAAFTLGFASSLMAAIFGMYLWAGEQFKSPLPALTAAAAYGLAPYLYFSLFDRASLPELWGMAFAPWLFWGAYRFIQNPTRREWITTTILYAGFVLTHNLSALLFTPLLTIYSLVMIWTADARPARFRLLAVLGLSLSCALVLDSFFLLPFLLESKYVQLARASEFFDYRGSFLSWDALFARPVPYDPDSVINFYPKSLAWPQLVLAAVAFCASLISALRRREGAAPFGVLTVGITFVALALLTLPISQPLWALLPVTHLMQFVWRVVGPATLLLAWLAGAAIVCIHRSKWQSFLALLSIVSFFFFSLSWTYHESGASFPANPISADIVRFEINNPGLVGTTTTREFLPKWVTELPAPETLFQRYSDSEIPSRLASLPDEVVKLAEITNLKSDELTYESAKPFAADFDIFYFPGWTATLDSQSIPIQITDPHGTMRVLLPAGHHTLRLWLQPTLPQVMGTVISALTFVLLIAMFFPTRPAVSVLKLSLPALPLGWMFLFIGLLGLRILVLDRFENIFWNTELARLAHPLAVNFDDQLELIGLGLPGGDTIVSGSKFDLTLYWRARQPLQASYSTAVHLVDAYGNRFGQSDSYYPANLPTTLWDVNKYARDRHTLISLTGAPPGQYHLRVSVYTTPTGQVPSQLLTIRQDGSPVGVEYDLGTVTVTRAAASAADALGLVEGSLNAQTVSVGDYLTLNVLWNSGLEPLPALKARIRLIAFDDRPLWITDLPPARADYPSDQWARGELVRYPLTVTLPPDLPQGLARVYIQLMTETGVPATMNYHLGDMTIEVPERTFDIPKLDHLAHYDFNKVVRLLGYNLTSDSIILYWQSLQVVPRPLTVFVHHFGPDGSLIAGQDSPPPRLTTSWLPGEVISDPHPLAVGDHFEIGLYDSATGERFGEPFVVQP